MRHGYILAKQRLSWELSRSDVGLIGVVFAYYPLFGSENAMPEYKIAEMVLDIARNAILLDTNVLVEAFSEQNNSARQEYADLFLGQIEGPLLVPSVVLVEAWGLLVGSRGMRLAGLDLLTWVERPGRAIIVPPYRADVQRTQQIARDWRGDCVDAMLVELATDITDRCGLSPSLPIATYDTRDFTRMSLKRGELRFRVFDMRSPDFWEDD